MTAEYKFNNEIEINHENIDGSDFRVSTVEWNGFEYQLEGFALPENWESLPNKIDTQIFDNLLKLTLGKRFDNYLVEIDSSSGIITKIKLDKDHDSVVSLDTTMNFGGKYTSSGMDSLRAVVMYQKVLAYYLNYMSGYKVDYPFIVDAGRDHSGSFELSIPRRILGLDETLTNEAYRHYFVNDAHRISGMFGTNVRYCKFNDKGILDVVQIDSDDCNYCLSGDTYYPHNVDSVFQAATLHGICARFLNDMLKRCKD